MVNMRLNKKQNKIQLKNVERKIQLRHLNRDISLKHVGQKGAQGEIGPQGATGPQGPQGPTGVSTFVRVHHGTVNNITRPSAVYVEWVGSVTPLNGTTEDTWIDTA